MNTETHKADYNLPRKVLQLELSKRVQKNPNYSMRAFATSIGISQTLCSLLLSGKKNFSKKMIQKMVSSFDLTTDEISKLYSYSTPSKNDEFNIIEQETFNIISEWHYYAILSLLDLPDFNESPKWIAKRLGITEIKSKLAIDTLKSLNIIDIDNHGRWFQKSLPIKVNTTLSTNATRKFQKQFLEKAMESLEYEKYEERVVSSITLAANSTLIPYVRKRIHEFKEDLSKELSEIAEPNNVYNFCLQFYSVTKNSIKGEKK